jgi:drug/metabolite transporter (DMT)-like permease
MKKTRIRAILSALLAAAFYAINMPLSKLLLRHVEPVYMASFLYFGAGAGIGMLYAFGLRKGKSHGENLSRSDLPYTVGMILLDIAAPILLMLGLMRATSANASLLNNVEIVATTLIALFVFREAISPKLWTALVLVLLSSVLLSFEDVSSLTFSAGSLLVVAAAVCWGLENNFTRKIAARNTFQIVTLKGLFSGLGSLLVALGMGDRFPQTRYVLFALLLGFVAYGMSIFLYVKAQHVLGAAKTSAFYAIAPFVGALLSFAILREAITGQYLIALGIMLAGSAFAVVDTLQTSHEIPLVPPTPSIAPGGKKEQQHADNGTSDAPPEHRADAGNVDQQAAYITPDDAADPEIAG